MGRQVVLLLKALRSVTDRNLLFHVAENSLSNGWNKQKVTEKRPRRRIFAQGGGPASPPGRRLFGGAPREPPTKGV